MLTGGGRLVVRRKVVKQLDVTGQRGTRENSFEEIVAQQRVLGDFRGERGFEGINVVNALSGVRAFAKEVLIDVGDSRRIGIDSAGAGEYSLVERALAI